MDKIEDEQKKPFWKEALGWVGYIVMIFAVTYIIITYVGQRTVVDGESMSPTLSNGDNLIVDKISYRLHEPKRFDVVIFPFQHAKNTFYIKRVIGLPGETVQVKEDGCVYINDEKLEENFGAEPMMHAGIAETKITLGEDEYFVLGDNRNHSSDSRDPLVGPIKRSSFIGRAWVRIYPFNKMGVVRHE